MAHASGPRSVADHHSTASGHTIPAAKQTYHEAAATPALDGATHVYVQRGGVGLPLADNYAGPYLVL